MNALYQLLLTKMILRQCELSGSMRLLDQQYEGAVRHMQYVTCSGGMQVAALAADHVVA